MKWTIEPPEQPYWRMYWNNAPGAAVETADQRIELTPNCLVLISPDTWFRGILRRPVRHTYVHALLGRPADAAQGLVQAIPLDRAHRQQVDELANLPDSLACELQALSLFTWAAGRVPEATWPGPPTDSRVARAQNTMLAHLANPPSNAELADAANLHAHAFDRLFRAHTGSSPHAWGLRCRLDEACRRLLYSEEAVTDIARACGFADHRHLGSAFRRRFDETPILFRRRRARP